MPTDRWRRTEEIFRAAVEQPAGERAEFVARTCTLDDALRDEVTSLLTAVDQAGNFLVAPALDVFARQISREGWSVKPGDRVGAYTVSRRLGAGGMGEVWRARDERLERDVAIKLLLPHPSNADERVLAFKQEARAAGGLNHTNVLTVYDVGDHEGAPYLVTECLEGESLRARLASGPLSVDAALDLAVQVARGLGAAHARGIVHRDLKPENIFLGQDGRVKILDFGLATLHGSSSRPGVPPAGEGASPRPLIAGTAGYMAPEQVRGEVVDGRADLFALGTVLYEGLTGHCPFKQATTLETLRAVLTVQPPELSAGDPLVPPELSRLVRRCIATSADDRFGTVGELESALDAVVRERSLPPPPGLLGLLRRPAVLGPVLLVLLFAGVGGWRWRAAAARVEWARTVAAPEVQRLANRGDYAEAFLLARRAMDVAPEDPHLRQLWLDVSIPTRMTTEPEGADVSFTPYRTPGAGWFALGRTPFEGVRIPRTLFRLRVTKAGFQDIEGSGSPGGMQRYRLDPVGTVPPGMVRVTAGRDPVRFGGVGDLEDFWIDRFEVTNRQFKEFVDGGGYRRRELWQEPFVDAGRTLAWEEAMARFHDASGRPGPATWTGGGYPPSEADLPAGGVSWYEAAAYARFAGKSLPTMYHWYRAAALGRFADILTLSNFGGVAPARVGSSRGLGPFGTYDMAGNVKEWCANEADHRRFLLGGGWNEAPYMFADSDARPPFERAAAYGFRLARYMGALAPELTAPVEMEGGTAQASAAAPVDEATFAIYKRQYAYDRTPLDAVLEATEATDTWVKETVAVDAAYGDERMRLHLFLPRGASPPYQTVIFFPAADAFLLRSSHDMSLGAAELVLRSGRAFLCPVYKGTYERPVPEEMGTNARRELKVEWSRDLGRAIDYLETRADVDGTRLAYYGISAGADSGVILTALEPRLKASVLQGTGLGPERVPEIDVRNYAPRIRVPTLMLNGRYDFETPLATAQRPLFALLGAPAADKRHVLFETGHSLPVEAVAREILPWLDRYLGPVARTPPRVR